MTVIACKDGVMAADTAVWQGGLIVGYTSKIFRLKDGRLFAGTGKRASTRACAAWLDGEGSRPNPEEEGEFGGLILAQDGIERVDNTYRVYPNASAGGIAVDGSHVEFLMGALLAGATAVEAVRLAIQYGDSAGGDVQAERL